MGHVGRCEVALIQVRVSAPPPDHAPRKTVYFVVTGEGAAGLCDEPSRATLRDALRASPSAAQGPLRARLEGARVLGVGTGGLALTTGAGRCLLGSAGAVQPGALGLIELIDDEASTGGEERADDEALEAAGRRIVAALLGDAVAARRQRLHRAIGKALARIDRRIDAVRSDLDRAAQADLASERARLFVPQAARAARGATRLEAVDWSSGEPKTVEMPLDAARGAKEQLDALFARARRLKQGAHVAERRLADARQAHERLARAASALATAGPEQLDELEAAARQAAARDFRLEATATTGARSARRARPQAPRPPHRTFTATSGARILVGRGAAHNDALTFHVARPHDLWLHAKGRTGAHVVVPLERGTSCPADVLVEAAHLAAHFSDARDEAVVEVQYAERRYLRKPRGTAPGLVVVDREKVMVLRRRADVLAHLLESETEPGG